jgi:hypothetical protein
MIFQPPMDARIASTGQPFGRMRAALAAILLCAALGACSKSDAPTDASPKAAAQAPTAPATTARGPAAPAPAAPSAAGAASTERFPAPHVPFDTKLCTVLSNAVAKSGSQKMQPAVVFVLESAEVFKDPMEFGSNAAKIDEVAISTCPAEREKFLAMAQSKSLLEALKPPPVEGK